MQTNFQLLPLLPVKLYKARAFRRIFLLKLLLQSIIFINRILLPYIHSTQWYHVRKPTMISFKSHIFIAPFQVYSGKNTFPCNNDTERSI